MSTLLGEDILAALGGQRQAPAVGQLSEEELAAHLDEWHGQVHLAAPHGTRRHDYLRQVHFTQHAILTKYGHDGVRSSFHPHVHVNTAAPANAGQLP